MFVIRERLYAHPVYLCSVLNPVFVGGRMSATRSTLGESALAPRPFWAVSDEEKSPCTTGNRTSNRPTLSKSLRIPATLFPHFHELKLNVKQRDVNIYIYIYISDDFPIHSDLFHWNAVTPVSWGLGEIAFQIRSDAETCRKKKLFR